MQNNPKTELHMHADPQMRIRLQLFWSIVTIMIVSTTTSLRSPCNVFHIQMQSMRRFHFGYSFTTTRNTSNEEKKKNHDNCSWPSWRGILQSCKIKAASSEEWMIQWIGVKAATWIVGEHIFRKYIPFTQRRKLKILGYAEKKKTILSFLENSCFQDEWKILWTNIIMGKKVSVFKCLVSVSRSLTCGFWTIFWEKSRRKVNDMIDIVGKTSNSSVSKTTRLSWKLATQKWKTISASFSS